MESFLDTYAKYYDYINLFVMSDTTRIEEYYGEGAFDPFRGDVLVQTVHPVFYDEDGNAVSVREGE
ncbi:MAG: hypothetical protein IKF51_04955 [Solobacterium sp.]|nr:hypothetical protein [Solobacterium sp.]